MIYGLSTILARIINFLFVPIYTRLLTPENYGVVTEFMAYIAVLQVVLVLGLETGCFRFANKEGIDPKKVYSSAFVTVFCVSATFLALMIAFASPIATMLGYEGYQACIMCMGGILAMDAVTAILFAINTFLPKPMQNLVTPAVKSSKFSTRCSICSATVS